MIVVTDTSVILNLCLLRQENLLVSLFATVLAPTQVVAEFQRLAAADYSPHEDPGGTADRDQLRSCSPFVGGPFPKPALSA